jgi:branched-chain amino acid transport system substrate-binding protein
MKWFGGLAALLLGALALGQSVPVVRLAVAAPLSGGQGNTGNTIKNGASLAVLEAQARFLKLGLKLEVVSFDDQALPAVGAGVARQIVADASILGVVGHLNSGVTLETLPIYAPANLVLISPSSTNPKVTDQGFANVARVCGRDDVQGPVAAEFIRSALKARRVLIINDGDAYGIGITQAFGKRAKAVGLAVVGLISNPKGMLSDSALLKLTQQVRLYNPEVIYYGGTEVQGSAMIKTLVASKIRAIFVGSDGLDNSNFISKTGAAAAGVYFTSTAGPISQLRGQDASGFVKRYLAAFKNTPETFSPYAFDAANMILSAIAGLYEKNKSLPSRAEVAAAVRELEWDGVTGRIRLNSNGDRQLADYFVLQYKTARYPGEIVKAIQSAPPVK